MPRPPPGHLRLLAPQPLRASGFPPNCPAPPPLCAAAPLAVDQGADDRGSRPVGNVPDLLFEVRPGAWYGWPDFIGGKPITDEQFLPTRGPAPTFVLANHDDFPAPEQPLLRFPPHVAAVK